MIDEWISIVLNFENRFVSFDLIGIDGIEPVPGSQKFFFVGINRQAVPDGKVEQGARHVSFVCDGRFKNRRRRSASRSELNRRTFQRLLRHIDIAKFEAAARAIHFRIGREKMMKVALLNILTHAAVEPTLWPCVLGIEL